MKEQLSLTVQSRDARGKGPNRRLRGEQLVPGVFYDDKGLNIPVVVADLPFRKVYQKVGSSHVFDLIIEKDGRTETHPSLIWVVQNHPWKNQVNHVDFYGIDPNKPVHISVALEFVGKAKGTTVGGKLEIFRESLEVVCLPAAIPDKIVIDVTELDMNQHVSVKDLALPEGVKALYDQNFTVVGVINPVAEAAEEEAAAK
jgi:large subunit ribosomal protein L25